MVPLSSNLRPWGLVNMWKSFLIWLASLFGLRLERIPPPADDPVIEALRFAFNECGVSLDMLHPEVDLTSTGKVYNILVTAARRLQRDHELRTVQDLIDWLEEAPRA